MLYLFNGRIEHGMQFQDDERRNEPTSFSGRTVALVWQFNFLPAAATFAWERSDWERARSRYTAARTTNWCSTKSTRRCRYWRINISRSCAMPNGAWPMAMAVWQS